MELHLKEPAVFTHTELSPQLWVFPMHSSMSVTKKRTNGNKFNLVMEKDLVFS